MKNVLPILLAALLLSHFEGSAQTYQLQSFSTGFNSPVSIANCGDSRIFIVQQRGKIFILDSLGVRIPSPFLDVTNKVSQSSNERGLLGLAFHPDYKNNGYFYINYTRSVDGSTRVSRFSVSSSNPNKADSLSEQVLLTIPQPQSNHNGGCIEFGPDGYLYIGMGDGGGSNDQFGTIGNGQNTNTLLGKMLRIDVDTPSGGNNYGIPADNPFVGNASFLPEIWAYGMRNPWRFSFDRLTGDLWIGDVGQNNWEEIDFEPAGDPGGRNYGWRCYEGLVPTPTLQPGQSSLCPPISSTTLPVLVYDHNGAACSVTGGYVYRGARYGSLYGKYLFSDYCSSDLLAGTPNGSGGFTLSTIANFSNSIGIVAFGEDRWGELYLCGVSSGIVYRLIESSPACPGANLIGADAPVICTGVSAELNAVYNPNLNYAWYLNGTALPAATGGTLDATQSGTYKVVVTNPANACADSATVTVLEAGLAPLPIDSSGSLTFCEPGGVFLSHPTAFPILWNTGASTNSIYADSSGTYSFSINYGNGCTDQSVSLNVVEKPAPPQPFIEGGTDSVYCSNGPVTSFPLVGIPSGGTFSGPGVSGNAFNISGLANGTYQIVYMITDNSSGCSSEFAQNAIVTACAGLEANDNNSIRIMPNPGSGLFVISPSFYAGKAWQYSIFGSDGKCIQEAMVNQKQISIDLSNVNNGVYLIRIISEGNSSCAKLILTR